MIHRIEAEGVFKQYTLKHIGTRYQYGSLRESITESVRQGARWLAGRAEKTAAEPFWALRDVSFQLGEGDRLGIVGRNGAGKSTLLKVLSRVTSPTAGKVRMRGRVASLLEVGTGFHPELSGRENIFLNGAILGMRRAEILRQFDAIVAFAEIERFLDTPVKRYSSGMYMRLAFSVAAHLEPEILIIDEVLAVGDARFQRKCLGRMQEIGQGGRTVLFVSHNLGAVRQLCNVAMVMDAGRCLGIMPSEQAVDLYQSQQQSAEQTSIGRGPLKLERVRLNESAAGPETTVFTGEPMRISLGYKCDTPGQDLCLSVGIKTMASETGMFYSHNHLEEVRHRAAAAGEAEVEFPAFPLAPGRYAIDVQAWLDGILVIPESRALEFTVEPVLSFASQTLHQSYPAQLMPTARWSFRA